MQSNPLDSSLPKFSKIEQDQAPWMVDKPDNLVRELQDTNNVIAYRSLRAQWFGLSLILVLLVLTSMSVYSFPTTLLKIDFGNFLDSQIGLAIPMVGLLPVIVFFWLIHRVLDTRYVIRQDSLIAIDGLASFSRKTKEIYFYKVRAISVEQSILGRILNYGNVRVVVLMDEQNDVILKDVRGPYHYKSVIERRLQILRQQNTIEDSLND